MEERGFGAAMVLHPLSLSGLLWYSFDPIWMALCTIPDVNEDAGKKVKNNRSDGTYSDAQETLPTWPKIEEPRSPA